MTKYTPEDIEKAVAESVTVRQVLKLLGATQDGGTHTHMTRRIKKLGFDTSHFLGKSANKGKPAVNKKTPEQMFVLSPEDSPRPKGYMLKRGLLELGVPYSCSLCGNPGEHQGKPLTLEIDHINGRFYDNRQENLRFLCPNCHAQCDTNKPHKNRGSQRPTVEKVRAAKAETLCVDCDTIVSPKASRCKPCNGRHQNLTKITWPSQEELLRLVERSGYSGAGRALGVSDNAIRKHLRNKN